MMPPSFIMTEAECRKPVEGYSFSAGRKEGREEGREEKERKKKLQKKREGTQQIEPFHHTLTSFTSAGIAKSFPHK